MCETAAPDFTSFIIDVPRAAAVVVDRQHELCATDDLGDREASDSAGSGSGGGFFSHVTSMNIGCDTIFLCLSSTRLNLTWSLQ